MIARAIAHGNAYTTYATLKENAQFICCENMAGDMTDTVTEELGTNKGIFLTWWNFWAMILLTVTSTGYAVYAAFNNCLWDLIWERLWLPFLFLVMICIAFVLIFWLNEREYRIPRY